MKQLKNPESFKWKEKLLSNIKENWTTLWIEKRGVDFGDEIIFGTASKAEGTEKVYNNIYLSPRDIEYCDFWKLKVLKFYLS